MPKDTPGLKNPQTTSKILPTITCTPSVLEYMERVPKYVFNLLFFIFLDPTN